jgi:hypothetical protein
MTDPFKFQRALFPEMEPRTIVVSKGGTPHRCYVVWCDKITDEIRKRVRGKNSKLFVSMHTSHSEPNDEEVAWELKI